MKAILRSGFLALAVLALAVPVNAGPIEDGVEAAKRGDFATALKFWRPLAEQGAAGAQYNLGVMYESGRGVPQDDAEAVKWFRLAAEQGDAYAQVNLGGIYANGRGVPQDFVQAHLWFSLAAAAGAEGAGTIRETVARLMTPDQIAGAERMASEWRAKHPQ